MAAHALGRHLALTGFMGAGKTTVGAAVAERLQRPFVDLDAEIERRTGRTVIELFDEPGEAGFRSVEEEIAVDVLGRAEPHVLALGGGAVLSGATRAALGRAAFTVVLEVEADAAWKRVHGGGRPLAESEDRFRALFAEREPVYDAVADARARDEEGVVLAAAGVHVRAGALDLLGALVPGEGAIELVADAHVAGIHGMEAQLALGGRDVRLSEVAAGESAKTAAQLEQLWRRFRIGRDGIVVALGGGSTTDLAGFAASTWLRGVGWVPVPTTLVGQVDAAIGGKVAIDVPAGKNLVGAFHWPDRVVVDPALLETLPDEQRRNGLAEVVKAGLLAGREFWTLPDPEQVRRSAAFKAAICLADPQDRGLRTQLNLGHTFAHALEAASQYRLEHGEAVALGLLAALRLSGNQSAVDVVESVLRPRPVAVDPDRAWAALARDKKAAHGAPRLVLLEQQGRPRWGVELPEADVRAALDSLIVQS